MKDFRAKTFPESLNYAVQGLVYAFRTQRNLRVHFFITVLVLLVATALGLSFVELALLALTIGSVITCEMINIAIEKVVDLVTQEYHPLAAIAKNVAAGAVLVTSIVAVAIGYFVFFPHLVQLHQGMLVRTVAAPPYVTFFALLVVLVTVLIMKMTADSAHVQGGMPSAHTAAAASLATSVFFVSESSLAAFLAAAMAVLVAQSRVEARIHTLFEVFAGGCVGLLLTILAFQLLK